MVSQSLPTHASKQSQQVGVQLLRAKAAITIILLILQNSIYLVLSSHRKYRGAFHTHVSLSNNPCSAKELCSHLADTH
jgi:hypothetical protein